MKATELIRRRIAYSEHAFAELILWKPPQPLPGSAHSYKYRLAYVVRGICGLRYGNEAGKGDHRHFQNTQSRYVFTDVDQLLAAFRRTIEGIQNEDRDA